LLDRLQQREGVRAFIGSLTGAEVDGQLFEVVETDRAIGIVGLLRSDAFDGSDYELTCALLEEAEGRGLATEACAAVVEWALGEGGLKRVIASVDDNNRPGTLLAERLGMVAIDRRPFRDATVFSTTCSDTAGTGGA
jgi:RimJ/RimL family protein N-acetyltransferase